LGKEEAGQGNISTDRCKTHETVRGGKERSDQENFEAGKTDILQGQHRSSEKVGEYCRKNSLGREATVLLNRSLEWKGDEKRKQDEGWGATKIRRNVNSSAYEKEKVYAEKKKRV